MIVESDQPLNRWLVQSTEQIIECRPATTIGHMNHVDPGHHVEQLAHQMCAASDTDRRHVELARIGLAIGDELGNRLSWDRRIYRDDIWYADDASDWRDSGRESERGLCRKRRGWRCPRKPRGVAYAGRGGPPPPPRRRYCRCHLAGSPRRIAGRAAPRVIDPSGARRCHLRR